MAVLDKMRGAEEAEMAAYTEDAAELEALYLGAPTCKGLSS